MLVKTSELIGPALDWAVAYAENVELFTCGEGRLRSGALAKPWQPCTDWSQCGPLIEKYKAFPGRYDDECEDATEATRFFCSYGSLLDMNAYCEGPTPLIAACRAIVAAKLGDQVDVPDELMQS